MEKCVNLNKRQRTRSSNWSAEMKESLRQLVEPKLKIIDSKENNMKFIKLKFDAWKNIQENMEALGHNIPVQRLKEQWSRMKMQARSTIADYKRAKNSTGGGECPEEPPELDFLISQMNPNEFEEDCAMFDSDNMNQLDEQEEQGNAEKIENKENFNTNEKSDMKRVNTNNNLSKFRRKRKTASSQAGEEMINCRTKLIKMESEHEQNLFNIRLEMEEMKKKHLEKMNELELQIKEEELQIKEEELQARRKENVLLNLKIERERRLIL